MQRLFGPHRRRLGHRLLCLARGALPLDRLRAEIFRVAAFWLRTLVFEPRPPLVSMGQAPGNLAQHIRLRRLHLRGLEGVGAHGVVAVARVGLRQRVRLLELRARGLLRLLKGRRPRHGATLVAALGGDLHVIHAHGPRRRLRRRSRLLGRFPLHGCGPPAANRRAPPIPFARGAANLQPRAPAARTESRYRSVTFIEGEERLGLYIRVRVRVPGGG
mmetsp:Transcript_37425/g.116988  ORF Transcript_37425/g.116988 Transcript_37425/m.116988 type:complete len:217 (-) Transcript_37425:52-702(-)